MDNTSAASLSVPTPQGGVLPRTDCAVQAQIERLRERILSFQSGLTLSPPTLRQTACMPLAYPFPTLAQGLLSIARRLALRLGCVRVRVCVLCVYIFLQSK